MNLLKYKIQLLVALSALAISCTEIIDINTQKSEPELVIEANLALNSHAEVAISKTIQLSDSNAFERIKTASVELWDDKGNTEVLRVDNESGKYYGSQLKGKIDQNYKLIVKIAGKTITAQSKIPKLVPIKALSLVNSVYPGAGKAPANTKADFYEITVAYNDPVAEQNNYRVQLFLNKKPLGGIYVYDDKLNNGLENELNIVVFNESIKKGDTLLVEMQCIDQAMFNFYSSLGADGFRPNSSSPANPETNLVGALLGYFNAHTSEKQQIIIEK